MKDGQTAGVVLIHGIGQQRRGDTLRAFLKGFRDAVPDAEPMATDPTVLVAGKRVIHFYEVYWADILEGPGIRGSFGVDAPAILSWFPLLNLFRGAYDRRLYPAWLAIAWTPVLVLAGVCAMSLYFGLNFFARWSAARHDRVKPTVSDHLSVLKNFGKPRTGPRRRSALDDQMDSFGGDVLNYIYSLAGVLPPESPITGCARDIANRFDEQLTAACRDGCDEIQIVSHSLGTVVMYHALSSRSWDSDPLRRVTTIYTLGSPLEKIGFLWPGLMARTPATAHNPALQWHNLCDRFDLVAGSLKRFDRWTRVQNHRVSGLGGAARAHVLYQGNPKFQKLLTESLLGHATCGEAPPVWTVLMAPLETLILIGLLILLALTGCFFVGILWLVPYFVGRLSLAHASRFRNLVPWLMYIPIGVIAFGLLFGVLGKAMDLHRRMLDRRQP